MSRWFRVYSEIIDDDKLRLLAFEDRWHFVSVLAMKSGGLLDEPQGELRERRIAVKLGLTLREAEEVRRRLREVSLIGDDWQPIRWDKRQFVTDHNGADRVRKHRERQRHAVTEDGNAVKQECNVTVTPPETDTDTDTDKEIQASPCDLRVPRRPPVPVVEIVALYHETLPALPRVEKLTDARRKSIHQRWREDLPDLDAWRNYFLRVGQSDFLMGRTVAHGRSPFRADLEWLCKPANFSKVIESKYDSRPQTVARGEVWR